MTAVTALILLLTAGLAAANGANDVSKGVATLAGAGVTRYRTAVLWGVVATLAGSMLSLILAARITKLFSTGIVAATPTDAFALAVLTGALVWIVVATLARLPVSTTHAIVGALIGAGLLLAPGAVKWHALLPRIVIPLLASIAFAYAVSAVTNRLTRRAPECICVDVAAPIPLAPSLTSAATVMRSSTLPVVAVTMGTEAECRVHRAGSSGFRLAMNGGHWMSSGATSFARGLNDTPKIVAIGAFGLVPGHLQAGQLLVVVALAMALGGVAAGIRVAKQLGENLIRMSHAEGFKANLTTAVLVGLGANVGLPMSTTHVSAGAIAGIAGTDVRRLHGDTLRAFVLAWTVTPATAALIAGVAFLVLRSVIP
jgi:PiT family inorganic phosphate transporter